ncbi:MarR family winged helix-turn-helix transcriptional regulator [Methanobrevibacter sp.]|uniref:MarR family winged helix-turn-helix transcriptional regulator n=1 Tax=Methanobrevibacter sp. TaxID=66852 RepID=UPI00386D9D7A
MADLNFDHERIMFTPALLYIDYINLHFKNYLKKNYEDITPYDPTYLANIFYNPNCSQKDLAELLFVSESNVAQIIKRLERNGLVKREVDEKNKSRRILNLTEKGKELHFTLLKETYEVEAKFFENYSPEDVEKFKKMLYDYSQLAINSY